MKDRAAQIGIDRLVRLDWLEKVSRLVLAGNDAKEIKGILQDDLAGSFHSEKSVRGSIDKTITILLKTWVTTPQNQLPLRNDGLKLLDHLPQQDHLAIHWGMVAAVYPFWLNVALQVGRLLRLQDSLTSIQVQRRIREQYGERETVSRRTRYVLRSYVDWQVVQGSNEKGMYLPGTGLAVDDSGTIAWLIEASLYSRPNHTASLGDLINSPGLFPFLIKSLQPEALLASSSRLDFVRHSLDESLVALRR